MAKKIKNTKLKATNIAKSTKPLSSFQQHANKILDRKKKNIQKKQDIVNRLSKQNKQNKLADLRMMRPKKVKFDLNDEDEDHANQILFTHKGKKIQQIQQFQDMISISNQQQDQQVVQNTHFGGFQQNNNQNKTEGHKSKKQIYQQIIAKSKMHKYLKQKQHEDNFQKAVQLDNQFPQLVQKLKFRDRQKKLMEAKNSQNDFQTMMNSLKQDVRIDCQKQIPKQRTKREQQKRKNKKLQHLKKLEEEDEDVDVRGWAKNIKKGQFEQEQDYDEIDDVQLSSDQNESEEQQQEIDSQGEGQQDQQENQQEQQQQQQQGSSVYSNKDQF